MQDTKLYTPDEVAAILKTSKTQILTYIRERKLKAARLSPRIIRISETGLREFIKNGG